MKAEAAFRFGSLLILVLVALACAPHRVASQRAAPAPVVSAVNQGATMPEIDAAREVEIINAGQFNPALHQESSQSN